MNKYLFLTMLMSSFIYTQDNYKKILIEVLKIAQDLMSRAPKGTVRVQSSTREFIISPEIVHTSLDRYENYPLHYAAQNGNLADVVQLIAFGAPIDKVNRWHQTALMKAVQGGNIHNVGYLLEKGARFSQESHPSTRFNPFHYTIESDHKDSKKAVAIINILAQFDPQHHYINMESRRGTPLELAIKAKASPVIIKALLDNGAQVTRKVTALAKKSPAILELLQAYL